MDPVSQIQHQPHQLQQDNMKQAVGVGNQTGNQPPRSQRFGLMNRPPQAATTSHVQQRPRREQRADQSKPDKPKRQFTQLNVSPSQALQQLLRLNLVTLRDPPKNLNTASPKYNPEERCACHSGSPAHDTDDCWALKNRIQDLIEEGAVDFTQIGQAECSCHPYKMHHLK